MLETFFEFLLELSSSWGYMGIFFLMTVESSFVPFPSELVIPPAAFLAAQGDMNLGLVIFWGIAGSLLGAVINYYLAMWLGRPVVYSLVKKKWAKYFLLNEAKLRQSEDFFVKNGAMATFVGRLIPAIRQLVSLPAGFSRMNFAKFSFYTALGAGLWVTILALLGYFLGSQKDILVQYYGMISKGIVFVIGAVLIFWLIWRVSRYKR